MDLGEDDAAVEDKRTMAEVMRDKRAKQDKDLEEAKTRVDNKPESIEERKARLAAQRDMLRKQMEEKRQQELSDFNKRLEEKPSEDLYGAFKKMD